LTSTTILLDLDDTLLGNDMNDFLPPYFAGLETSLQEFTEGKDLRQITIASVRTALTNQEPTVTNMAAFMAEFTRLIGHPAETIQPALDAFYGEAFPKLRQYIQFRPEARLLVRRLFAAGATVVIATNPLFPATAIEQRLAWAGVEGFPYALVTTMENSHFAKPNPRYYQEILAHVDGVPERSWMIGDNPENDIAPARALGLKTWWITGSASDAAQAPPACDGQGSLADLLTWVEAGGLFNKTTS